VELFKAASRPKEQKWYDANHGLNGQAFRDRAAWLRGQIKIGPVDAKSWQPPQPMR
jgi:hypothetical protein